MIHILEMLDGLIVEGRLRRFHNHPAAAEEQRVRRWGWPGQCHSQCSYESAAAGGSAEEEGGWSWRSGGWCADPGAAASGLEALGQSEWRSGARLAAWG